MIAYIHTINGTKKVRIRTVKTNLTEKQLDALVVKFNKEVRVIEWVGGCTYTFRDGSRFIKSSSLEELFEMYKAHKTGQEIPERKCFFIPKTKLKK